MPDDDDHDDGINNVHTENSILRLMLVDPMIRNRYGHNL